jgi:Zn-dependent alcohol dehydrogenase
MYGAGKLKLNELVTTYRLEEVNQAFAHVERGENAWGVISFPEV